MAPALAATGDPAQARIGGLRQQIRTASWFAACGEALTAPEIAEADAYLAALGFAGTPVRGVAGWMAAASILRDPAWLPDWWDREEAERARLLAAAEATLPRAGVLAALSEATADGSTIVHGLAAVAAARAGIADPALIRVAAGAGTQAAYQAALARLGGAGDDHAFAVKFRLFQAGRWPLGITAGIFHLF